MHLNSVFIKTKILIFALVIFSCFFITENIQAESILKPQKLSWGSSNYELSDDLNYQYFGIDKQSGKYAYVDKNKQYIIGIPFERSLYFDQNLGLGNIKYFSLLRGDFGIEKCDLMYFFLRKKYGEESFKEFDKIGNTEEVGSGSNTITWTWLNTLENSTITYKCSFHTNYSRTDNIFKPEYSKIISTIWMFVDLTPTWEKYDCQTSTKENNTPYDMFRKKTFSFSIFSLALDPYNRKGKLITKDSISNIYYYSPEEKKSIMFFFDGVNYHYNIEPACKKRSP